MLYLLFLILYVTSNVITGYLFRIDATILFLKQSILWLYIVQHLRNLIKSNYVLYKGLNLYPYLQKKTPYHSITKDITVSKNLFTFKLYKYILSIFVFSLWLRLLYLILKKDQQYQCLLCSAKEKQFQMKENKGSLCVSVSN